MRLFRCSDLRVPLGNLVVETTPPTQPEKSYSGERADVRSNLNGLKLSIEGFAAIDADAAERMASLAGAIDDVLDGRTDVDRNVSRGAEESEANGGGAISDRPYNLTRSADGVLTVANSYLGGTEFDRLTERGATLLGAQLQKMHAHVQHAEAKRRAAELSEDKAVREMGSLRDELRKANDRVLTVIRDKADMRAEFDRETERLRHQIKLTEQKLRQAERLAANVSQVLR